MKITRLQMQRLITTGGLLVLTAGLMVAPGCSAGTVTPASVFASRSFISEEIVLADGSRMTLNLGTNAYRNATGGFVSTRKATRASRVEWPITIPLSGVTLSGTFDPDTGEVNLSGVYTGTGGPFDVHVTGNLPADNSYGTLTVALSDGRIFNVPVRRSDSPVVLPSPGTTPTPAPTPSPTPTPTPSPTPPPTNGTLTVTNRTGNFPAGPLALGKLGGQRGGDTYINFTMGQGSYSTYPNTLIEFNLIDSSTPSVPFRAGDIFNNLGTTATNYPVRLNISRQLGLNSALYFKPASGTLRITAITSTSITVSLENVVVVASGAYPTDTPNSGGATLNGTLTANF
ncbi:hypothetical protein [Armatimonas rosea]|uniref:Uncharacterized protein n=1 Tax=Armatimonas rosea TaxID=685828 RepID=A0A7W9W4Z4_ARMRO|nr:hypothetical protein [Armatimonas rosea]MBB6049068.1 hypothetical protein [Armatimonas rosea]